MTDSNNTPPNHWFPAKTYGWGWGLPITWQGWVVLALFGALMIVGIIIVLPIYGHRAYMLYTLALAAVLVGVCWLKGESPRWQWGDSNR